MRSNVAVGIDIGGTGIKAAVVDLARGVLTQPRHRTHTPDHPTPDHVVDDVARLLAQVSDLPADTGTPVGVGFPGVVKQGVVLTAAHLDDAWIGTDAAAGFTATLGRTTRLVNDADAAGLAEVRYGAGAGVPGVVVMVTLGTGIGTGLFTDGILVPNTELGHLTVKGRDAETRASALVRETKDESWKEWGHDVDDYLAELERLLWPDLIIIGGGVSTDFDKFREHLKRRTRVVAATLGNDAGIIGAALRAAEEQEAGR